MADDIAQRLEGLGLDGLPIPASILNHIFRSVRIPFHDSIKSNRALAGSIDPSARHRARIYARPGEGDGLDETHADTMDLQLNHGVVGSRIDIEYGEKPALVMEERTFRASFGADVA